MSVRAAGARPIRVLLTEGNSTSAREAITALALAGHEVSFCDPSPVCLGRFSRLAARRYRCPPLGSDPHGFRAFVRDLVAGGRFDVLLPIHEQGFLFARVAHEIRPHAGLALPAFETYARMHSKLGFGEVLTELGLGQPRTRVIADPRALGSDDAYPYPYILKAAIGTASRGTWPVRSLAERTRALTEIGATLPGEPVLRQDWVDGPLEQAQAVVQNGRLVGFHAARRLIEGAGGGAALKESVERPEVAADLARIAEHVAWHGALSVDFFWDERRRDALYIDANPRLVEPMAAKLAGLDLADMLVRVSLGEPIALTFTSRPGVRSRLALQALLGAALKTGSRRAVLGTVRDLVVRRGVFAGASEELNPVGLDPPSLIPLLGTAGALLADPGNAGRLARRGWGAHLLNPAAARAIRAMPDAAS